MYDYEYGYVITYYEYILWLYIMAMIMYYM